MPVAPPVSQRFTAGCPPANDSHAADHSFDTCCGGAGRSRGASRGVGTPVPSPATPNPSGSPTPGPSAAPSPPTMPAAPAADPANWKQRIPIVRSVDANPLPGETPVPPGDPGERRLNVPPSGHGSQEQLIGRLSKRSPTSRRHVASR